MLHVHKPICKGFINKCLFFRGGGGGVAGNQIFPVLTCKYCFLCILYLEFYTERNQSQGSIPTLQIIYQVCCLVQCMCTLSGIMLRTATVISMVLPGFFSSNRRPLMIFSRSLEYDTLPIKCGQHDIVYTHTCTHTMATYLIRRRSAANKNSFISSGVVTRTGGSAI